jgi:hypothetical protein
MRMICVNVIRYTQQETGGKVGLDIFMALLEIV